MSHASEEPEANRQSACRRAADRRSRPIGSLLVGGIKRRRRGARRDTDRHNHYPDWHDPFLLYVVVATLLLCFTDAVLTLNILGRGGSELNWFMAQLIERDVQLFAWVKMAVSGLGLVFLVAHAEFKVFRWFKVRHVVTALVPVYGMLVVYELVLLSS